MTERQAIAVAIAKKIAENLISDTSELTKNLDRADTWIVRRAILDQARLELDHLT